jgi:hypothetical protein
MSLPSHGSRQSLSAGWQVEVLRYLLTMWQGQVLGQETSPEAMDHLCDNVALTSAAHDPAALPDT